MNKIKVLDCTLRDGGYYNNWDFSEELVNDYLIAASNAKIDMIELGLRNFSSKTFKGAHAFTTERYLNELNLPEGPKYGVMVDAKTLISSGLEINEATCKLFKRKDFSKLDFVRVAAHYHEIDESLKICIKLKELGYFVGLNLMQSVGKPREVISDAARSAKSSNAIDVLYYADSLGNMSKDESARIVSSIKEYWDGEIGLHAHDNTSRALSNTLHALEIGVTYLDSTITGMGRGAGNTKSEILLFELDKDSKTNYTPSALSELVLRHFEPMQRDYGWGTNFLYYIGATSNVHPTYIQQLYSDKRFGAAERAAAIEFLSAIESSSFDGENLEKALNISKSYPNATPLAGDDLSGLFDGKEILIIGAGDSVTRHKKAILQYIEEKKPTVISININNTIPQNLIDHYTATHNIKYLTDKEKYKTVADKLIAPRSRFHENGISPKINYEMSVSSNWSAHNTHCEIPFELTVAYALSACLAAGARTINLVGFDGYPHLDERNRESQETFDYFKNHFSIKCLTPTSYNLDSGTIYAI